MFGQKNEKKIVILHSKFFIGINGCIEAQKMV
jgi:hypothetical protein